MQLFSVHLQRHADPLFTPDRRAVFVAERFSWVAFLLTWIWALLNGHLLLAVILLAAESLVTTLLLIGGLDGVPLAALLVAWRAFVGFSAANLIRASLRQRGFVEAGIVAAEDTVAAERRFFSDPRRTPVTS
jgi:hypothetical protein